MTGREREERMSVFKRFLTEEEQVMLLRYMKRISGDVLARRDGALMRLLLSTGMRVGETLAMTVGDALEALRSGWIFIPAVRRKGQRRDHTVLVTVPVREALSDLLAVRSELVAGMVHVSDALLVGRQGALTIRRVEQLVKRYAQEAGLPEGVTPHWFRHTRAKNIMRRSTSSDPRGIVQAALGHASIASTGIYTAVSREELVNSLAEVDGPGDRRRVKRGLRAGFEARADV